MNMLIKYYYNISELRNNNYQKKMNINLTKIKKTLINIEIQNLIHYDYSFNLKKVKRNKQTDVLTEQAKNNYH